MTPETPHTPVWVRREISVITLALLPAALLELLRHSELGRTRRSIRGVVATAAIIGSSTIRVVVNNRGLEVGFGPWGWPRRLIPLERIASARVEKLSPLYYGFGLGYRAIPGRSRVILWPGPGVVVETTDGHTFGVTVRDAARAVELINQMVGRDSKGVT